MNIIEPLENESTQTGMEKSDPVEKSLDNTTDDARSTESEFAPWDD